MKFRSNIALQTETTGPWITAFPQSDAGGLPNALPSRCRWLAGPPLYGADARAGRVAQGTPPEARGGQARRGQGRASRCGRCHRSAVSRAAAHAWAHRKTGKLAFWAGGWPID